MRQGRPLLGMAFVVALVACGSGEQGADSVGARPATSSPQTTVHAASTTPLPDTNLVFHTLLAKIPNRENSLEFVVLINFELAAQIFDVPDRTTDPESWYSALSLEPDGPRARSLVMSDMDKWRAEVGFSAYDELGEAVVQDRDGNLDLHLVDVDATAIDRAVRTEPAWSDVLIDAEVSGIPYYTWGEVDLSIATQTATHEWVEGGFMAVSDHVVSRTKNEDLFVDSLTVTHDQSLADNPDVALILDSFAEHQAYSMALTNDTLVLGAHGYDRLLVLPYRLLGTGQAFDGNQRQVVLAFVHDDEDGAIENAARFDAILTNEDGTQGVPYAERFESFDISVDGVLVSVVLDVGSSESGFWVESLLRDEPLYWADGG